MRIDSDPATMPDSWSRPCPVRRARTAPEFPGCRPITLLRCDLDDYDGRFEYWDGDTETAWVSEPTSDTHEIPSHRLAGLSQVIAGVRGSPIECLGTMDLLLRNAQGERWRILQADQSVYLHPARVRLPEGKGMVLGEHDFPDVVVEVDHTTDVRRGKLGLYEEWGFPEVWVEVPERDSPSRPAGRRPGLAIHLLEGGRYRLAEVSRAFPGWTAAEIHAAVNEPALSEATGEVLTRVGRALGAREGTGPDDTPWLRMQRQEGREEGRAEGWAEGRARSLEAIARRILASRGIPETAFRLDAQDLADVGDEDVVDALLACRDASDFRVRLRGLRR